MLPPGPALDSDRSGQVLMLGKLLHLHHCFHICEMGMMITPASADGSEAQGGHMLDMQDRASMSL